MPAGTRRYLDEVPTDIEARVRRLCLALPDAYEQRAWVGTRWMVRKRTFAHVLVITEAGVDPAVALAFRAAGEDLAVLRLAGFPFFELGWGRAAMGMVLDERTDWGEVAEVVFDSFAVMAPKKLLALAEPPPRAGR